MSDLPEEKKIAAEETEAAEEEKDDGKIKLTEILAAALDFNAHPQDEEKYDHVNELVNAISVRERMPLMEKDIALAEMLAALPADAKEDAALGAVHMELVRYFFGLLKYAVNLKIDVNYALLDASVYDVLEAFGVGAHIRKFCGEDYANLCLLLNDAINFRHIDRIVEMSALFSDENMEAFKTAVLALKTELTPEKLAQMKAFIAEGDPAWQALKETVTDTAVENALLQEIRELNPGEGEGSGE